MDKTSARGAMIVVPVDKNLRNVVKDLEVNGETRHDAQQLNQDRNDRHKESVDGKKGYQENENSCQ